MATGTNSNPKLCAKRMSGKLKMLDEQYDWKSTKRRKRRGELVV